MSSTIYVYLVRHAIAEERGPQWPDDGKRPLSTEGKLRMETQVAGLEKLGVEIEEVLTSPLVRTRQTAEILAKGLSSRPKLTELAALAPGHSAKEVLSALKDYAKRSRIALVGHEPGIGDLSAALIGARNPVTFKKGGVALVKVERLPPDAGSGALCWFLAPKILRMLASS
jgi:phosphohistidine phosphatase